MKRMLFLLAFLLAPSLLFAQAQQNLGPRTLSVQDAGTACSLDYACATFALIQNPPSWTFGISGTYSGTLTFQATIDGSNWTSVQVSNLANGVAATTTTSTGNFAVTNTGFIGLRVVFTTRSSGSASVTLSDGGGAGGGGSSGGGGGAVTVADGADVALGTTTDAAVGDATGTVVAHTRQIAKTLAAGITATLQTQTDTVMVGGVNVKEINGVAPTMGNGTSGTGVQRVTLASDSTGQVALAAGTAQIGSVTTWGGGTLKQGGTASITNTTSTSVIAGTGSNYLYITGCRVTNTSTSIPTLVILTDGNAGTTIDTIIAPAGGGSVVTYPSPLKVTTQGNGLFMNPVTTNAAVIVYCNGWISTVSY